MVNKASEKWRGAVVEELIKQSVPLPSDLIVSLIHVESRGRPGLINKKSGASGLTQVMPVTLKDFNKRTGKNYTMNDLQKDDYSSALKQIEVGISVLSNYWRSAFNYLSQRYDNVPIDELAHIADLFYVAGPGATKKRLNQLSNPTWHEIQNAFPKWNALPHPRNVFKEPIPWDIEEIAGWLSGSISKIAKNPVTGFAFGILILMATYWLLKGKSS
jgi:hypothetical protein